MKNWFLLHFAFCQVQPNSKHKFHVQSCDYLYFSINIIQSFQPELDKIKRQFFSEQLFPEGVKDLERRYHQLLSIKSQTPHKFEIWIWLIWLVIIIQNPNLTTQTASHHVTIWRLCRLQFQMQLEHLVLKPVPVFEFDRGKPQISISTCRHRNPSCCSQTGQFEHLQEMITEQCHFVTPGPFRVGESEISSSGNTS